MPVLAGWPGLTSIGMVYRRREFDGQREEATVLLIMSLPPQVRRIAHYVRGPWKIENSLQGILGVTFHEDASRIRKDSAPEIASAFGRFALTLFQQDTTLNAEPEHSRQMPTRRLGHRLAGSHSGRIFREPTCDCPGLGGNPEKSVPRLAESRLQALQFAA